MTICDKFYDVIVVGAGGGGLRSAVGAAQEGARVLVVCRGKANRSGATLLAGANISADIACDGASLARLNICQGNKDDTKEAWFQDTVREGFYLNNQAMVELFVQTAADRLEEMICWGMTVRGMEGDREVSVFGSDILDTLYRRARELHVDFMEDTLFTDLIVKDGAVCGVTAVDLMSGEMKALPAKAVVLATGGAHNLFPENSGSTDLCGEGQAAAIRAGAEMIDMEMISFCPTVTVSPTMYKGNILPYILFSSKFGRILNKFGKTFTDRYLSKSVERLALDSEWNKMLLSYALNAEIQAGRGTRQGGVYFALDLHPKEILEELYAFLPPLKTGMYADIMKIFEDDRSLVIKPAPHYFEGGIRVNPRMESSLPGLFAAGECTGGMFGANRVSAATTEMMVDGAAAGRSAGQWAGKQLFPDLTPGDVSCQEESVFAPLGRNSAGESVAALREALHSATAEALPVIRTEEKLKEGLSRLDEIDARLKNVSFASSDPSYNREWRQYLELRSMLPVAREIMLSALRRRESRGVHVRGDALFTDNQNNLVNICLKGKEMEMRLIPNALEKIRPEMGKWTYTEYIEKIVAEANGEEEN